MNKRAALWGFCAMLFACGHAQPTIDWQQLYGGSGADSGFSIAPTADGGYIVLGRTLSNDVQVSGNHGLHDLWVIKIDAIGGLEWQRCLGGSDIEEPGDIEQTPDGGYVLIGRTSSNDGDVSQLSGDRDIWVVRLTPTGEMLWERSYGGTGIEAGRWLQIQPNGDILLFGNTTSPELPGYHGGGDLWLGLIDQNGNLLQQRCYGGTEQDIVGYSSLVSDGRIVLCGTTGSNDGDVSGFHDGSDAWVALLDENWDIVWQKCLGGSSYENGTAICSGPANDLYVAVTALSLDGEISSPIGSVDYWIVRLSGDGNILAERSFGGTEVDGTWCTGYSTMYGLVVYGITYSTDGDISDPLGSNDAWLISMNTELDLNWELTLGGSSGDSGRGLCFALDGSLLVVGITDSFIGDLPINLGSGDLWVVKFNPETVGITEASSSAGLTLYPNPSSDQVRIQWSDPAAQQLEVADALGRVVYQEQLRQQGNNERVLAVGDWANGLYTVRVLGPKAQQVSRFIKKN